MLDVLFSRWVFIHLSLHESKAKVLGMPSPEMQKWIYFMLSNNKFFGKCWYGWHPWIRLAMESESYGGKRNEIYFLFGNPLWYIYAWKVLGTLSRFCWWDGYTSQNVFISIFPLWALAPLQIPTSLCEGPFFYFMQFLFLFWVSISSHKKHQLGRNMIVLKYWV